MSEILYKKGHHWPISDSFVNPSDVLGLTVINLVYCKQTTIRKRGEEAQPQQFLFRATI